MASLFSTEALLALLTLTSLEIVLGIDNIIFLTLMVDNLPEAQRPKARVFGLGLAMLARIALFLSITWVMKLNTPLLTVMSRGFSGRELILLFGGLFLIAKSTHEIHGSFEPEPPCTLQATRKNPPRLLFALTQITLIDIVLSLDSVITAVGMSLHLWVMISAIVISILIMMLAANAISQFVSTHPTIKMLALSFLMLIGVTLLGESLDFHIPKGYIYFAMAFSFAVEMLNIRIRRWRQ